MDDSPVDLVIVFVPSENGIALGDRDSKLGKLDQILTLTKRVWVSVSNLVGYFSVCIVGDHQKVNFSDLNAKRLKERKVCGQRNTKENLEHFVIEGNNLK